MTEKTKSPLRFIIEDTHAIEIGLLVTGILLILLAVITVYKDAIEFRLNKFYELLRSVSLVEYLFLIGLIFCFCGVFLYTLKAYKTYRR